MSHHRLPTIPVIDEDGEQQWLGKRSPGFGRLGQLESLLERITHCWNERKLEGDLNPRKIKPYWRFPRGLTLPIDQPHWRKKTANIAGRLLALRERPGKGQWLDNPYVAHLARLSLMLADHHYSSLPAPAFRKQNEEIQLFANTDGKGHGKTHLKQPLDKHLLGVAKSADAIVRALPDFERHLPRLARHRGLRERSRGDFGWQNKAADTAEALRP
ncbi:MAG: type I-F CRISPR-associated helicase Cas3, partial [Azoarcus sp.]|nr:type I-F CRISPR-associated helicase Cas3 [Azoarcus sp.]